MGDFFASLVNDVQGWSSGILELLPKSPFKSFINSMNNIPYMDYINYFLPIDICLPILVAWGTAIGIFYLYSILLRWIKAIE